jgi:hypothetical protein
MKLRITVLFVGMVLVAAAQVPLHDYLGDEVIWCNARMLASGGVYGLESGASAAFANPALLGFARRPAAELSYGLKVAAETRTRIVYDQFENSLGEIAVAENMHGSGIPGPLAAVYPLAPIAVGAGIAPVRDFNYTYLKEYRDDFYVKTGEDRVEQSGVLYNGSLGVAYNPVDWLAVGARGGYQFGSRRYESWQIRGADTTYFVDTGKPAGIGFGAGLAVKPIRRLAIAADFSSGMQSDKWSEADSGYVGKYPWSARLGLSYRVPGTLPSTVTAEARYKAWKSVDSTMSDLVVIRAGVEHTLLNFVSLRYGFGVEPQPYDPTIQRLNAGFGLGFDVGVAKIDVGALMTHDVIGPTDFSTPLSASDLKVYENRSHFAVTISRSF